MRECRLARRVRSGRFGGIPTRVPLLWRRSFSSGSFCQSRWQKLAETSQPFDFKKKSHVVHFRLKTAIYRMFSGTCSLLRQVCGLSGSKIRPLHFLRQLDGADRASGLAVVTPLRGTSRSFLALGLIGFTIAAPCPVDAEASWKTGSSFASSGAADAWSKSSSFSSTDTHLKPKAKAPTKPNWSRKANIAALSFKVDPSLTPIENLRNLISSAEAGHLDYDAVVMSAPILPPDRPTLLTIGQIRDWVAETPNQNHAIGRYQFIPATFERLAKQTAVPDSALFTENLQDRWANILIEEAGYTQFVGGTLAPGSFMDNLALIWAGLPLATGKSAYEGVGGNHATLARETYQRNIALIFPAQIAFSQAFTRTTSQE